MVVKAGNRTSFRFCLFLRKNADLRWKKTWGFFYAMFPMRVGICDGKAATEAQGFQPWVKRSRDSGQQEMSLKCPSRWHSRADREGEIWWKRRQTIMDPKMFTADEVDSSFCSTGFGKISSEKVRWSQNGRKVFYSYQLTRNNRGIFRSARGYCH